MKRHYRALALSVCLLVYGTRLNPTAFGATGDGTGGTVDSGGKNRPEVRRSQRVIVISADVVDRPPQGKTYASGVNENSIVLKLNGTEVTPTVTAIPGGARIRYNASPGELNSPGTNTVTLAVRDNANAGAQQGQDPNDAGNETDPDPFTWSFSLPQ